MRSGIEFVCIYSCSSFIHIFLRYQSIHLFRFIRYEEILVSTRWLVAGGWRLRVEKSVQEKGGIWKPHRKDRGIINLGGDFKYFLFSLQFGEDSRFG